MTRTSIGYVTGQTITAGVLHALRTARAKAEPLDASEHEFEVYVEREGPLQPEDEAWLCGQVKGLATAFALCDAERNRKVIQQAFVARN